MVGKTSDYVVTEGQRFGRWKVIGVDSSVSLALCVCDCGTVKTVRPRSLLEGTSKSCGCLRKVEPKTKVYQSHGMSGTPLYKVWLDIRRRDKLKRDRVVLCNDWKHDFLAFKAWAELTGYKPNQHLVRIDTMYGHEPENCSWEG